MTAVLGWVNEGMTEMTGYAVDEIQGKKRPRPLPR